MLTIAARPVPQVLDLIIEETTTFPALVELTRRIRAGEATRRLTWAEGLIYFNRRVLVDTNSAAKRDLLTAHDGTPGAGAHVSTPCGNVLLA